MHCTSIHRMIKKENETLHFTHDSTCSAAKQAVMTANACKFLRFRMTARAKG
jgi:hypothetical protein